MRATRRKMLTGAAAMIASTSITGTAVYAGSNQGQDAGLLALCDRYWAARGRFTELDRSAHGVPRSEWDALYDRVGELDDEAFAIAEHIADATAHTPTGLLAKLRIIRLEAGYPEGCIKSKKWDRYECMVAMGLWTAMEDVVLMAKAAGDVIELR